MSQVFAVYGARYVKPLQYHISFRVRPYLELDITEAGVQYLRDLFGSELDYAFKFERCPVNSIEFWFDVSEVLSDNDLLYLFRDKKDIEWDVVLPDVEKWKKCFVWRIEEGILKPELDKVRAMNLLREYIYQFREKEKAQVEES